MPLSPGTVLVAPVEPVPTQVQVLGAEHVPLFWQGLEQTAMGCCEHGMPQFCCFVMERQHYGLWLACMTQPLPSLTWHVACGTRVTCPSAIAGIWAGAHAAIEAGAGAHCSMLRVS